MRGLYVYAKLKEMKWAQKHIHHRRGFTIVELLIVVVVIAILAAVTIVAYNGIQNRAKTSAAQSTASQSGKKLATYYITHSDTYPTALTDSDLALPNASNSSQYQYTVAADQKSYCLTTTTNGISYYTTNTNTTPMKGACAGHGVDGVAAITNLVLNPRPSTSYWFASSTSVGTVSFLTVDGMPTARSTRVASGSAYALYSSRSGVATGVEGDTYTAVFKIKASTNTAVSMQLGYGSGSSGISIDSMALTTSWQTLRYTFQVPAAAAGVSIYPKFTWTSGEGAVGDYFDVAEVMWVKGTYAGNFADGNSANWVWNGTAGASTSTGPAL